jgi:hypothetical protein
MLDDSLRQIAKRALRVIALRLERITPAGELPRLDEQQARAGNFYLRLYLATIDEYAAQAPAPIVNVGDVTQEDLTRMFAHARRPTLS